MLIKKTFAHAADPWIVNLAVAFVSGAPALSNVVSFVWANLAHGRARIGLMVGLQAGFAILVGLLGVAPRALGGLAFAVASILVARVVWTGILTVRAAVWSANYPRAALGRYTGRIVIVSSLAVVARGGAAPPGRSTTASSTRAGCSARARRPACSPRGCIARRACAASSRCSPRRTRRSGAAEPFSLGMLFEILRKDPHFREYMFWMGVFGGGNLMLTSQLVVIFSEHLHLVREPADRAAVGRAARTAAAVRAVLGAHVRRGARRRIPRAPELGAGRGRCGDHRRARGCGWLPLLWLGAVLLAFAYAGANLGWNLGHNDFASVGRAQHYMGVHVTLTGVRGAIGPPAGILIYQWLESLRPGLGFIRWCCRSSS